MVYADFDADPATGPNIDPNGNRYNTAYSLRELDQAKIYDTLDRNQSGMLVYVLAAGVKLAWPGAGPAHGQRYRARPRRRHVGAALPAVQRWQERHALCGQR